MPGADFNRQVYRFRENRQIWDQNDYEERTKQEAEIMVALEALKTSTAYLLDDIHMIKNTITDTQVNIGVHNKVDIWQLMKEENNQLISSTSVVDQIMGVCRHKQQYLNENRDALVLYCQ